MKIPISKNWFGESELAAVQQPLRDGWVVQGNQVAAFECAAARVVGVDFALACSSGTAAIHIAIKACGIKHGDEVIVPTFTWIATANVVELEGAVVKFCDIDLTTFNLAPERLQECLTPRTVGIIPVHMFGLCANMDAVIEFAAANGLWVVEDAACALGSRQGSVPAGAIGDIGCFSFHPRKIITTGEGGMMTTRSIELARRCDSLRNHGASSKIGLRANNAAGVLPDFEILGFNYRLTDIQGAIGVAQMQRLSWFIEERRRCAAFYNEHLAKIEWLITPLVPSGFEHTWQSYVVLYAPHPPTLVNGERLQRGRNRLMLHLAAAGISTRQGTHAPPFQASFCAKYGYQPAHFPAGWLAERISISLPIYPGLTQDELDHVVSAIKRFNPTQL